MDCGYTSEETCYTHHSSTIYKNAGALSERAVIFSNGLHAAGQMLYQLEAVRAALQMRLPEHLNESVGKLMWTFARACAVSLFTTSCSDLSDSRTTARGLPVLCFFPLKRQTHAGPQQRRTDNE